MASMARARMARRGRERRGEPEQRCPEPPRAARIAPGGWPLVARALLLGLAPMLLLAGGAAALRALPDDLAPAEPEILAALLAAGLALSGALWTARAVSRPLRDASAALRRLAEGESLPATPPPAGAPPEVLELQRACERVGEAVAERARLSERVRWLANFDPLTGLANRALLRDRLELALAAAARGGGLAVLALDLDRFRQVNEALGHAAGDAVLRQAAQRLRDGLRGIDTLAHMGADSFALVAPGVSDPAALDALAERLGRAMLPPFEVGGQGFALGLSLGAAVWSPTPPGAQTDPDSLLRDAEFALSRAKAEGRGGLRVFAPEMDQQLRARRALTAELGGALRRGEFFLLFQPQVAAATGTVLGAEALLRWRHPTRGTVAPDLFIPLAEETGLIVPLGAWVLEEACRVAARWPAGAGIAVNVSAQQVRRASFIATVEAALASSGLDPSRLELEITEAVMLTQSAETAGTLSRLRTLGVRLAMDDFGTGYSSLATLQRFRFDKIKVDRGFIREIARDERSVALLRAVVCMGGALGVRINAEGVEDEAQLALLRAEGVDEAQGWLFGRPMPAADLVARLPLPAARGPGRDRDRAA